uniref:Methyltransferase domain-containing protein n=2 Tax=Bionectria ochroleuca TaxID=29856 RepID=A0A0B7KMP3_BIOOC
MSHYDNIGLKYNAVKSTPWGRFELFNFKKHIQPFLSKPQTNVLDLGCGTGFYTELLAEWGATTVTAVDVSTAMLAGAKARLRNSRYASMVEFVQGDGLKSTTYGPKPQSYDLIAGVWFLNYAKDFKELVCMFSTICINLKQGGVFVGVCMHPVEDLYNFIVHHNSKVWAMTGLEDIYQDRLSCDAGYMFKAVFHPPKADKFGQTIEFEAYHLKKSLYEAAARLAGLQGKLEWQHCDFPDNLRGELGLDFDAVSWEQLKAFPQLSILTIRNI